MAYLNSDDENILDLSPLPEEVPKETPHDENVPEIVISKENEPANVESEVTSQANTESEVTSQANTESEVANQVSTEVESEDSAITEEKTETPPTSEPEGSYFTAEGITQEGLTVDTSNENLDKLASEALLEKRNALLWLAKSGSAMKESVSFFQDELGPIEAELKKRGVPLK